MKKSLVCGAALLVALSFPVLAAPTEDALVATTPGAVVLADSIKAAGTISAIDAATRTITLKNAEGKTFSFVAGEKVKNFDKFKVGDKVNAEYLQVVTVELLKKDSQVRSRVIETDSVKAKSAKAGGAFGEKLTVVGNVLSVDKKNSKVRVQGVEHTMNLKVNDPEQLKLIKKGDQIKATYTHAFAMMVNAAK